MKSKLKFEDIKVGGYYVTGSGGIFYCQEFHHKPLYSEARRIKGLCYRKGRKEIVRLATDTDKKRITKDFLLTNTFYKENEFLLIEKANKGEINLFKLAKIK